jgi:hypothetical protein
LALLKGYNGSAGKSAGCHFEENDAGYWGDQRRFNKAKKIMGLKYCIKALLEISVNKEYKITSAFRG